MQYINNFTTSFCDASLDFFTDETFSAKCQDIYVRGLFCINPSDFFTVHYRVVIWKSLCSSYFSAPKKFSFKRFWSIWIILAFFYLRNTTIGRNGSKVSHLFSFYPQLFCIVSSELFVRYYRGYFISVLFLWAIVVLRKTCPSSFSYLCELYSRLFIWKTLQLDVTHQRSRIIFLSILNFSALSRVSFLFVNIGGIL